MTKQRHCFVTQVGDAIEALASALDPERKPPFKGDVLDLLEWAEKDVLEMRAENGRLKTVPMRYRRMAFNAQLQDENAELGQQLDAANTLINKYREETTYLRQQLAERNAELRRINLAINDDRIDLTITAAEAITELRQQLERTRLKNAIVYGTSHPEIYKTKEDELRQQLAELLDWQQKAFAACPNIDMDIDRMKGGN